MILITGTVAVALERSEAFIRASEKHVSLSRLEPGCIAHGCHEDTITPGAFVFVEKWTDHSVGNEHLANDCSRAFAKETAALASNHPEIEIHDVAATRTVTPGR